MVLPRDERADLHALIERCMTCHSRLLNSLRHPDTVLYRKEKAVQSAAFAGRQCGFFVPFLKFGSSSNAMPAAAPGARKEGFVL
jgi:hypothetical protein